MQVKSFVIENGYLQEIIVELTLVPGLPGIQFLGLPDQHLKESSARIKAALRASGFDFPSSRQVLVNLRPSHFRKSSKGLDLAVALAFLWETGQIPRMQFADDAVIYGELNLAGEVFEPVDLENSESLPHEILLTGGATGDHTFAKWRMLSLQKYAEIFFDDQLLGQKRFVRPSKFQSFLFSKQQARLIKVLAIGGHSCLIAGPSGSGKSTVAKALTEFLPEPDLEIENRIVKRSRAWGEELHWLPLVAPHHTTPVMSLIGGGSVPFAGEISKADGGVLLLDEFLEFHPTVLEALRGPFEEKKMRVARLGRQREYSADAQIIGTTNLCPCGDWVPEKGNTHGCRFSLLKCRSYSQKLSGPLLDRFDILVFLKRQQVGEVSGCDILEELRRIFQERGEHPTEVENKSEEDFLSCLQPSLRRDWQLQTFSSHRRRSATMRVMTSLKLLEGRNQIGAEIYEEALVMCRQNQERLRRWEL